ncbi:DNA polymerase I-like protein [Crocosphaera subtropica ATCC 51142]|uniref:DNA polymerase I n=1 Tax=Crocosphaera subtropica (strain ATCC 51142 / BH68) TaxID=43989 RepID=B1X218_CROS5|nr:bifunctional 3'-5' exonuclease/DNA polymerase [Crocosphaera subtropica]ACB54179.1 DNA polymerase I-like protein [Crocosphaera subtropica ATCC 51142]
MATKQLTLVLADTDGSSKDKLGIDLTNLDSLLEKYSKNLTPYPNADYEIISDDESLVTALKELETHTVVGLDIETTGLDPHTSEISLIQIAAPNRPVILIEFRGITNKETLRRFIEHPKIPKVGHNLAFEIQFLTKHLGINPAKTAWIDTMLMSQLLAAGLPPTLEEDAKTGVLPIPDLTRSIKNKKKLKQELNRNLPGSYSLMRVVARELGYSLDKSLQVSDWGKPLTQEQLQYAANDAAVVLPLREALRNKIIDNQLTDAIQVELGALARVAQMGLMGMGLDLDRWGELAKEIETRREDAAKIACQVLKPDHAQLNLFGGEASINLDSNEQVIAALARLGIHTDSTSKDTLDKLSENHPEVFTIIEYRHWSKAHSSFGEKLPTFVNPVTHRIHPNVNQMRAASGRFSFSNPNLQQIPRERQYRSCFVPAPGYKLIIADYSQIELRIAAEIANDSVMIDAYCNEKDLHRLTAALVSGKDIDEVTKQERQLGKAVNFGLIYGMGATKLRIYAETNYGVSMTFDEAQRFRDNFFKGYPGLHQWHQDTACKLRTTKVKDIRTLSGRLRRWKDEPPLTSLLNTPVQGTSADITKLALHKLNSDLDEIGGFPIVVVHDEIVLEVPEDHVAEGSAMLEEAMVSAGKRFLKSVPVVVEAAIADSWAEK